MTVKIYRPEEIKDANLVSSTLPEPDASRGEVEWQGASFASYSRTYRLDSYGTNIIRSGQIGIFVSNDNGSSYSNPFTSHTYGCCVDREDPNVMYFTTSSAVYKSTDGGANFSLLTTPSVTGGLRSVSSIGSRVVVVGGIGVCLVSNDYGSSFSLISIGAESTLITDVDINDVYTLACDRLGNVYYSYDNHSSWTKIETGFTGELYSVAHHNGRSFISGEKGFLSVSTDAGRTWTTITTHLPYSKSILEVATSESGYLCIPGRVSGALVSTDLGATWIEINGGADQAAGIVTINDECVFSDVYLSGGHITRYPIYRFGDERIQASRKYQCLVAFNQDSPVDGATGDASATWIDMGPTNRWAMFDGEINTKSRSASGHTVNLTPSYLFDSVSVFGCKNVTEVRLTVRNSANAIIFQRNEDMNDLIAALEWQQDPLNPDLFSEVTIDGIPTAAGAKIELQFIGNNIEVGLVTYGLSREIGESLSGLSQNYFDYSKVEYNDFGRLIYLERPIVKLNTYNILVEREKTRSVDRLINSYRGQNLVWSGSTGNGENLVTYGRAQRSPLVYEYPNINELEITVRGSI